VVVQEELNLEGFRQREVLCSSGGTSTCIYLQEEVQKPVFRILEKEEK
jgi:hypothetical protein